MESGFTNIPKRKWDISKSSGKGKDSPLIACLKEDDNSFICQPCSVRVKENLETIQPSFPASQMRTKKSPKDWEGLITEKWKLKTKQPIINSLSRILFCCITLSINTLVHMFTFDSSPWPMKSAGIAIPVLPGGSRMKWLAQSHTNWVDTRNEMPAFKSDALCSEVRHPSSWRKIEVGARSCTTHCQSLTFCAQILSFHTRFAGLCLTEPVFSSDATKSCYPGNSHHLS